MLSHCHSLGEGRGRVTESSPCAVTGPKLSLALRGSSPRSLGSQCWFRQGPPHECWRGECTPARCPRVFLNKRFLTTPCTCRRDNSCASDGSSLHQVRLQLPPFRIQSSQQMEADPRAPSMHRCGGRLGRSRLSAAQEGPHFQLSKGDTSFARALLPQSWFPLHRREVIWCFHPGEDPTAGGAGTQSSLPSSLQQTSKTFCRCVQVSEKKVAATATGGLGNCPNSYQETDL